MNECNKIEKQDKKSIMQSGEQITPEGSPHLKETITRNKSKRLGITFRKCVWSLALFKCTSKECVCVVLKCSSIWKKVLERRQLQWQWQVGQSKVNWSYGYK